MVSIGLALAVAGSVGIGYVIGLLQGKCEPFGFAALQASARILEDQFEALEGDPWMQGRLGEAADLLREVDEVLHD